MSKDDKSQFDDLAVGQMGPVVGALRPVAFDQSLHTLPSVWIVGMNLGLFQRPVASLNHPLDKFCSVVCVSAPIHERGFRSEHVTHVDAFLGAFRTGTHIMVERATVHLTGRQHLSCSLHSAGNFVADIRLSHVVHVKVNHREIFEG